MLGPGAVYSHRHWPAQARFGSRTGRVGSEQAGRAALLRRLTPAYPYPYPCRQVGELSYVFSTRERGVYHTGGQGLTGQGPAQTCRGLVAPAGAPVGAEATGLGLRALPCGCASGG